METKLDKLIFNYPKVPSRKFKLVAVPMYMYTVQTNNFKNGMDFFEKAVLRFKTKPGFKDEDIARLLGVDEKLVKMIDTNEISSKQAKLLKLSFSWGISRCCPITMQRRFIQKF